MKRLHGIKKLGEKSSKPTNDLPIVENKQFVSDFCGTIEHQSSSRQSLTYVVIKKNEETQTIDQNIKESRKELLEEKVLTIDFSFFGFWLFIGFAKPENIQFFQLRNGSSGNFSMIQEIKSQYLIRELILNSLINPINSTNEHAFITTDTNDDSHFLNQECPGNSSFYSTIQKKCVECRNGWLPFKNVCYQGFTIPYNWQGYVNFCASLNSTLLIAEDVEKFNFFRNVSKYLTSVSSNQRTWVSAKYTTVYLFAWTNKKTVNVSFFGPSIFLPDPMYCFAYSSTTNYLLHFSLCVLLSNGICEYTE
ncbi:unnamed protein product [Brachionus calyciflorus]|uniref:C-type lectin domain-containing protein n=1 Tax=Brachionus calyciflorus TaxID=104777 RepID=A0A814DCV8_9BILA|nr:unnamed protein product [Brachionus calyciflorus]